tara:strand:- start:910 stop:1143 length:234 start_codon:yes stop_codon:yes gene_type:complete
MNFLSFNDFHKAVQKAHGRNGRVTISRENLGEVLGMSPRAILDKIDSLVEKGVAHYSGNKAERACEEEYVISTDALL